MSLHTGIAIPIAGLLSMLTLAIDGAFAAEDNPEELVNFAFARYLGTGYYSTDESRVYVFQLPLRRELRPMSSQNIGVALHYPVTIGLTDFRFGSETADAGQQVPDIDDVATISLVPGLEFLYPLRDNWHLAPFIDLGIAHDLNNDSSTRLVGLGVKSFMEFEYGHDLLTLGHRLLYAEQGDIDGDDSSSFSFLQTGLDYRFGSAAASDTRTLNASLYYIYSYYLNDLGIPNAFETTITFSNTNEFGFTFNLPQRDWLPEDPRLGFGVQFADDIEVYRVVFGMPLF